MHNGGAVDLPIGYTNPDLYYGSPTEWRDSQMNRDVGRVLERYKIKTILDIACGTGSQVFWLIKHGYRVTGVDVSPGMLKVARRIARKERMRARFLYGDMRSSKVGSFDAAITIFNAVGNITRTDFKKTMRSIRRNLKHNGLYVFDILNKECDVGPHGHDYERRWTVGDTKFHKIQICRLDKKTGILRAYDRYWMQKGSDKEKLFSKQRWTMQIYSAKELRKMLNDAGFKVLGQYALNGSKLSEKKTKSIMTVAQKIGARSRD